MPVRLGSGLSGAGGADTLWPSGWGDQAPVGEGDALAELRPGRLRVAGEAPSQACPLCAVPGDLPLCRSRVGACSARVLEERGHQARPRSWGRCPQRGKGLAVLPSPGLVLEWLAGWHCGRLPGLGAWAQVSASPQGTQPDPEAGKPFGSSLLAGPALAGLQECQGRVLPGGGERGAGSVPASAAAAGRGALCAPAPPPAGRV